MNNSKADILKPLKCVVHPIINNSVAALKKYGEFEKYNPKVHNQI